MANIVTPDNESASGYEENAYFGPLAALAQVSRTFAEVLPVENWHPPFCGETGMKIARDGTWFYRGSRIERPALVRLFARLLRKDEDRYVLVTPVECLGIEVEDVPFIAPELETIETASGQSLKFSTNAGDMVLADAGHPLRFEAGEADGLVPYLLVRGGLWARLTRPLTTELMAYASVREIDGKQMFGIASEDVFFPIMPAGDLNDYSLSNSS